MNALPEGSIRWGCHLPGPRKRRLEATDPHNSQYQRHREVRLGPLLQGFALITCWKAAIKREQKSLLNTSELLGIQEDCWSWLLLNVEWLLCWSFTVGALAGTDLFKRFIGNRWITVLSCLFSRIWGSSLSAVSSHRFSCGRLTRKVQSFMGIPNKGRTGSF